MLQYFGPSRRSVQKYLSSLLLRKLYEVVEDAEAAKDDMIRVIDESGESYLYSRSASYSPHEEVV